MIVDEIRKQIPNGIVTFVQKEEDPRDYKVSFEKIKLILNYKITKTIPDGVTQIKEVLTKGFLTDPDDMKYRNS